MFISIDIKRVLDKVYALSALRSITEGTAGLKETLGPDHEKALRRAMTGAMTEILAAMAGTVADTNIAETDDESEAFTLSLLTDRQTEPQAPLTRSIIEEALTLLTIAGAERDDTQSRRARTAAEKYLISIRKTLTPAIEITEIKGWT